jgi:hypothetical protein
MQVVSAVPAQGADTQILAMYDDTQVVPAASQPQGTTLIRFIKSQYIQGVWPPLLTKDWINDLPNIAASEASLRVEACYTAAQQRSAALIVQDNMIQYGTVVSSWPASAQTQYSEIQRGLAFINTVHASQQTIVAQTILDPCNDQYWPAPITPISL